MTWFDSRDIKPKDKQPIMVEIYGFVHIAYWYEEYKNYYVGMVDGYQCHGVPKIGFDPYDTSFCFPVRWKPFFLKWELEDGPIDYCENCDKKHEECVKEEME